MKAIEFIDDFDIDEGWKDIAAAGILGTGLALGSPAAADPMQNSIKDMIHQVAYKHVRVITDNPNEELLMKTAMKHGIRGVELAQFMAQTKHESGDFSQLKERGNKLHFAKYDPQHNARLAAQLGNIHRGDGARYAGRGFMQLTGRKNYRQAGEDLNLNLEKNPELLERPDIGAEVAVWYWMNRVHPHVRDFNNTAMVTKFINPSLHGLQARKKAFAEYKAKMNHK